MSTSRHAPIVTTHHGQYLAERLAGRRSGLTVSVCIPARNEAGTLGPIVETILGSLGPLAAAPGARLVDEVVVVDDGSSDKTGAIARDAGARVTTTAEVIAAMGPGAPATPPCGKGLAMWAAAFVARGDLLVFVDADVVDFGSHFVTGLLGPLLAPAVAATPPGAPAGATAGAERGTQASARGAGDDGGGGGSPVAVELVKGFYERPETPAGGGGRVTELTARPVLSLCHPHLAAVRQPLAGETACRRSTFASLAIPAGYGVEIGMLLDVAARWGTGAIAQVDLGVRRHRNRPLAELAPQAREVLGVALARAGARVEDPPMTLPPLAELPGYRARLIPSEPTTG